VLRFYVVEVGLGILPLIIFSLLGKYSKFHRNVTPVTDKSPFLKYLTLHTVHLFSIDNGVYVAKDDKQGMQRLIEYMSRCPCSLARIIKLTETGKVLYRAVKASCRAFPILGNEKLKAGTKRNFEASH
jgi:hypothetical protein